MTPSATKPEYTVTACRNCGVQLLGADDLEPGHPQPYCFDPEGEVPLFQDEEISVVPSSRLAEERERGDKLEAKCNAIRRDNEKQWGDRARAAEDNLQKARVHLEAVREWAEQLPQRWLTPITVRDEIAALLPEEEGT